MEYRDLKKQYQVLKKDIDKAIESVCTKAHFIGGEPVALLEKQLADYVGIKHCIACANGTDALQLALMVWGIGAGDVVFVPDFTYFSSGEVVSAVGATPIFVDVDKRTYNLDPEKLEQAIEKVWAEGKYQPKAVIAVDLFGLPADYDRIRPICNKHNLLLLEDGAQGFGGSIVRPLGGRDDIQNVRPLGGGGPAKPMVGEGTPAIRRACSLGDISTTSFFPAKPVGCYGDGGAIFTDNDEWAALLRSYAVHGKGTSKYDNIRIGMNSRLDTIQATILQVKLKAFREYELTDINKVAAKYTEKLQDTDLVLPYIPEGSYSSWAQYTVQLPKQIDRAALQTRLKEQGVPTMVYYQKAMHRQLAFAGTDSENADCEVTDEITGTVLSLPLDPYKTEEDVEAAVSAIKNEL